MFDFINKIFRRKWKKVTLVPASGPPILDTRARALTLMLREITGRFEKTCLKMRNGETMESSKPIAFMRYYRSILVPFIQRESTIVYSGSGDSEILKKAFATFNSTIDVEVAKFDSDVCEAIKHRLGSANNLVR